MPDGEEFKVVDATGLQADVDTIEWFHRMDLGQGVVTPGVYNPARRLRALKIPASLRGKTVLDVGAWDGFYSFEAERRGAARVVATDSFAWNQSCWGSKAGFELARRTLKSKVEDVEIDVLDLSPERVGTFDLVFFLGVLYHMRHPLLAVERLASVTRRRVILETAVDLVGLGRPAAAFYAADELGGDPTNWWGPNPGAVCGMLRAVGFSRVEVVSSHRLPYRIAAAVHKKGWRRHPGRFRHLVQRDRIVVHAWK